MEDEDVDQLIDPKEQEGESSRPINESLLKSRHYFDLEEAAREFKSKDDDVGKVVSSAKFAGKLVSNMGMFGLKLGARAVENIPELVARTAEHRLNVDQGLSEEQRGKLESLAEKRSWGDYFPRPNFEESDDGDVS